MALITRRRFGLSRGFSLIELMVVLVVMAILITATISRYSSAKQRFYDATMKSDLKGAMTSMEDYRILRGELPADAATLEATTGFTLSSRVALEEFNRRVVCDETSVRIKVSHPNCDNAWFVDYPALGSTIDSE